jgi:DNA-binding MurR/RpiR family transcriptional regulator
LTVTHSAQAALDELQLLADALDETQFDAVARVLAYAPRIFLTGEGAQDSLRAQ